MENSNRYVAGIDLHKKYSFVTIMDRQGYIQHQGRFENREHKLIPTLQKYGQIEATVESTYGWYWLADELERAAIPFFLAHPQKVKALVGTKKTDREDSKALADLLRGNLLPRSYVPTHFERNMKEFIRFRMQLVHSHLSMVRNRLRDILAKQNINCPYTDILGKKSLVFLSSLNCSYPYKDEIESLIELSRTLAVQIDKATREIKEKATLDDNAQLLVTIPGIGKVLSLVLSSEIGDVKRFPNDRALASYAGVVPAVYSSGGKTYLGQTGLNGNPYIRWALAEAVKHIVRKDPAFKLFYENIKQRKGHAKAKVAVMNKMIRAIYVMLTRKVPYRIQTVTDKKTEGLSGKPDGDLGA